MNRFEYTTYAQKIVFQVGALDRLAEIAEGFYWRRMMLCTSASQRAAGRVAAIEAMLGDRLAAIYEPVRPHVPDFQVAEALALADEREVDAIIGLGGGSAIGMAKAVGMALEARRRSGNPSPVIPTAQPLVSVVAIPTTYAGSEMTPVYGVTHQTGEATRKVTVRDPRVTPKVAIYDPALTLDLPPDVTASSGINALAHCIEALYSIDRNPLSSAAALSGVRYITQALPRCYTAGDDLEARTGMLIGAHLAATALSTVSMALHHGLCHVLGGTAGVPHGLANSIILPFAMRFNLDVAAPDLAAAAAAMGIETHGLTSESAAAAAADRVYQLVGEMNLPQRLRDVGVRESDLPELARLALESSAVRSNPRPVTDADEIERLLRAAW